MNVSDLQIKEILLKYKNICVLGLSPELLKPSHYVPLFMKNNGYTVVGVYPKLFQTTDMKIYTDLQEVPIKQRAFVNVFRRSESVPEVIDEVLRVGGCEVLWLQQGVQHQEAEERAQAAGLLVISDRCLKIEYSKYF